MKYAVIDKKDMERWFNFLKARSKVYGPKKKENAFVFSQIEEFGEMSLLYKPTILPPKKYYFPQKEALLDFKVKAGTTAEPAVQPEDTILFAVHTCDIAGIQCLDAAFSEKPEDPYYLKRKEKIAIIGIECLDYCDEYASCAAMDTHVYKGGYDIMLTDLGESYAMHINSQKGDDLIKVPYIKLIGEEDRLKLKETIEHKLKNFHNEFDGELKEVDEAFEKGFFSPVWKDVGKRCVGCTNCTAVCPTCYCFDVEDDMSLNLEDGTRYRVWSYCQMDDFAKVAAGEDFRSGRDARQRHRYFRKFKYSVLKFNKYFCTGCGRCTRVCMAKINLVETVNSLLEDRRGK